MHNIWLFFALVLFVCKSVSSQEFRTTERPTTYPKPTDPPRTTWYYTTTDYPTTWRYTTQYPTTQTVYYTPATQTWYPRTIEPTTARNDIVLKEQVVHSAEELVALATHIIPKYHGEEKVRIEEEVRTILGLLEEIERFGGYGDIYVRLANHQSILTELLQKVTY